MAVTKSAEKRPCNAVEDTSIKLPKNERLWVSYCSSIGKKRYILTGTILRDKYILYFVEENGRLKKLGECGSPNALEEKFGVLDEIRKKF